ncbi:hypothetical protein ABID19_005880 [Mesorhizobium robiniae]|uniref:Transposase n=1 Tax=Mesorhizobium robiniae TaxID=559315 RepID=A0ABV2GWZ6_9HYPH|nr:transposase [Mesorhizobium sp. ZC-5]
MKRQIRPFIVEVKQKRGNGKQSRSIWGDLDLSAIAAETMKDSNEEIGLQNRQHIDSHVTPIDVEDGYKPRAEHLMADLRAAELAQSPTEAPANTEAADAKKKRTPRPKAAKAQLERPARKPAAKMAPAATDISASVRNARKTYSAKERGQLLLQIEKSISRGESIKSATAQASISEQTYYQWKKKATPPASDSGELKDLIALEEENAHLKKLLAERLRKENAELKKKLGLN